MLMLLVLPARGGRLINVVRKAKRNTELVLPALPGFRKSLAWLLRESVSTSGLR